MSAAEARDAAMEGVDGAAPDANVSKHDDIAAGTADGVDAAIAAAQEQGTSVGTVPNDPKTDPTPSVDVSPAAAEQQAVDESYKSGDSPYEFSKGDGNAEEFKAQADRVYGK